MIDRLEDCAEFVGKGYDAKRFVELCAVKLCAYKSSRIACTTLSEHDRGVSIQKARGMDDRAGHQRVCCSLGKRRRREKSSEMSSCSPLIPVDLSTHVPCSTPIKFNEMSDLGSETFLASGVIEESSQTPEDLVLDTAMVSLDDVPAALVQDSTGW